MQLGSLNQVFTEAVIAGLKDVSSPSDALIARINILTASDPDSSDEGTRRWNRYLCARNTAWDHYIGVTRAAGLLDADIEARLRSPDDSNFRSAMAECMTCRLLAHELGLHVFGRHEGRPGTALDFGIARADGNISVEVKSPYAEKPSGSIWGDDHSHILERALDDANKRQFAEGRRNVLALVPQVDFPVLAGRSPYIKAFFGEQKLVFTIDRKTGRSISEPEAKFIADGKFLRLWPLTPRFTRLGAVLAIREALIESGDGEDFQAQMELRWFVLHNPNCPNPIPEDLWGACPQLVVDDDVMRWTDDRPIVE